MRGCDYGRRVATRDEKWSQRSISLAHSIGGILPSFQEAQLSQRCRCCRTFRRSFLCLLHLLQCSFLLVSERSTTVFLQPHCNKPPVNRQHEALVVGPKHKMHYGCQFVPQAFSAPSTVTNLLSGPASSFASSPSSSRQVVHYPSFATSLLH